MYDIETFKGCYYSCLYVILNIIMFPNFDVLLYNQKMFLKNIFLLNIQLKNIIIDIEINKKIPSIELENV